MKKVFSLILAIFTRLNQITALKALRMALTLFKLVTDLRGIPIGAGMDPQCLNKSKDGSPWNVQYSESVAYFNVGKEGRKLTYLLLLSFFLC